MFYLNIKCVHFEQKESDKRRHILLQNLVPKIISKSHKGICENVTHTKNCQVKVG